MFGLFDKADVTITIPENLIMEESFECKVDIIPKSDASLRKIEIEMFCQETAITRSTTNTYYRRNVFSDLRIPVKETQLRKGQPVQYRETFKLPNFSTPTIYVLNHYVEWFVRVRLDVPWWPDTRQEKSFLVHPFIVVPELFD